MNVTIHYCPTCGFRQHAETIGDALRSECGANVALREAFWGTFRIERDGAEIFNRWRTRGLLGRIGCGRMPTPAEIVARVRQPVVTGWEA